MDSIRCVVWTQSDGFQLVEVPLAEPGPGEVMVRVEACGVCMTDVHYVEGLLGETEPRIVLGHEWSGRIEAIGPGVRGLAIGMPVAGMRQGGYAERVVVSTDRVFPIPADVPLERAAFVEPFAACLAAVKVGGIPLGGTILVTGAGSIGLQLLQLARQAGAARAIVSEPNPTRRAQALRVGADFAIDPRERPLLDAILSITHGNGVDVAFETAGHSIPLADCIDSVAERGTVVMVGVHPVSARLDFNLYPFHRQNLTLRGSYGVTGPDDIRAAVSWLGRIDFDSLISHRFDLPDVAKAFDVARSGQAGKVMITLASR